MKGLFVQNVVLQPRYKEDNLQNHFMDTGSLLVYFETKDLTTNLEKLKDRFVMFDFSRFKSYP